MARILSGDPRLGPLAGQGYSGPLSGGWSPDFSEASPAPLDLNPNPMAVDRMGMLRAAMEGAAARYRVAQPVGSDPTYLHDLGRGYAGPLGGVVGDLVTPPNFNTGDPWQDGLNAGMMFGGFGGPAKFETQVGYHLKDVDRGGLINLDRATQRARNRAVDTQDWVETELPLRSINGTQLKVNPDYAAVPKQNPELPLVIKTGGQYYAQDGHHRLVAAAADGKQTAKVRLIDLDKTGDPSTPLLDWTPPAPPADIKAFHDSPGIGGRGGAAGEAGQIFDYSGLREVPKVPQFDLPRYAPARGVSERVQDLVRDQGLKGKMMDVIQGGVEAGGPNWYNTEPLRVEFVKELGKDKGEAAFRKYMDFVAATSPRSTVGENARNASFYYHQLMSGKPLPEVGTRNPTPYGHMAQKLHQANALGVAGSGWDPLKNPKPASFVENLVGNQRPATVDAHAFKLPGMLSEDPRFLAGSLKLDKNSPTINPSEMFASGDLSMEEALNRPVYWAAQPNKNEYAAMEKYYQGIGGEMGLSPAQTQASAWVGGGKLSGLGSDSSKPFLRFFEDRLNLTAKARGVDPKQVLKEFIRGKVPLLSVGGAAVTFGALSAEQQKALRDQYQGAL